MPITHEDLILLARLLGNHCNDRAETKLCKLTDKLLRYADRTLPGGAEALEPLDLGLIPSKLHPGRVIFFEKLK
jgi:hypothetical protein